MSTNQSRVIGLNDLGQLTMRANVAFAVRCAQRLRPCFVLPADAPRRREQEAAVDGAIRVAEAFCRGVPVEEGQAAAAARRAYVVAEATGKFTRYAAYGAVHAAKAADQAERVVRKSRDSSIMEVVAFAFGAGRVLAANADPFTLDVVSAALYGDMDKLRSMAQGTCADLGPPIDPSESGPLGSLWPDQTPAWCARKSGDASPAKG